MPQPNVVHGALVFSFRIESNRIDLFRGGWMETELGLFFTTTIFFIFVLVRLVGFRVAVGMHMFKVFSFRTQALLDVLHPN